MSVSNSSPLLPGLCVSFSKDRAEEPLRPAGRDGAARDAVDGRPDGPRRDGSGPGLPGRCPSGREQEATTASDFYLVNKNVELTNFDISLIYQ